MGKDERTFIMIKPDGVQRGLIGTIISRFEQKGFFNGLIEYMQMGPVCAMVWQGAGAVATGRVMLGATKPSESCPGSIRGDLCIDVGRNICHGSDSVESATKEIKHWFTDSELTSWTPCQQTWVYE